MKKIGREREITVVLERIQSLIKQRKVLIAISTFVILSVLSCFVAKSINNMQIVNAKSDIIFDSNSAPIAVADTKRNVIAIPSGIVKANPFVPYRSLGDEVKVPTFVNDVPKFDLISPPEELGADSEAVKIMDTVVSGILYDKFSPSAILKIDGNDYLVKKGDEVQNYKVTSITQDSVTVKYGNNTYKAGIGEILTNGSVNYNKVSNLNKKFGGEKR